MRRLASFFLPALLAMAPVLAEERPLLVTVDDLPLSAAQLHPEPAERERITRELLAILDQHGIRAVGFVVWGQVRSAEDRALLDLWLEAGHELGNHSWSHPNYRNTESGEYIADIERAREGLDDFLEERDERLRFFRFPMLREGDTRARLDAVRDYLEASDQSNLPPTLDTQDWSFNRPWIEARRAGDEEELERIGDRYQRAMSLSVEAQERLSDELFDHRPAQILLLHANEVGTAQWDPLFRWLLETGHRFADVDEVLDDPALAETHDYVGDYGPGFWYRIDAERRATAARHEIETLFNDSIEAWNRGDLEAFCYHYADDARFTSPSGLNRGREEVLARYLERYPDRAAMGELSFEFDEIRLIGGTEVSMLGDAVPGRPHGAAVTARWILSYPDKEPASGRTLVILQRIGGRWQIVEDASM
jgi:uncharacterized protein (TIGR02246 family)